MAWPHGFHVRHLRQSPGATTPRHTRHEHEVIMMHAGHMTVGLPSGDVDLGPGDVLTIPVDMPRQFSNTGSADAEAYVVRGGDHPAPPTAVN